MVSPPKGKGRKWRKKNRRTETCLRFFLPEKKWRLLAQVSLTSHHDSSVSRANRFTAQDESSKCRFPRSASQTCITTKISINFTYYQEILSLWDLRSCRTTEYYVLSLRTTEKRKDWIWIGFQSGPPFYARTIESYVPLRIGTIGKWLY